MIVVDSCFFFFWLGFRHPAVFFGNPSPLPFFRMRFFPTALFSRLGREAAANEVVEPAKNIRPVMSAIMTRNVLGIIIPFR